MEEDLKLLRFGGMMGHTYVGIIGAAGERRTSCETSDLSSARRLSDDDPTLRVYCRASRRNRPRGLAGWRCCYQAEALRS